jgi:nicotinamidase-related amidase
MPIPTTNVNGHPSPSHHRALLILDAQVAVLDAPPSAVPASRSVRANILRILTEARAVTPPPLIVHVRNNGYPGDPDEFEAPGWQLVFEPLPHEPVIDKRKNNAFAGTVLGDIVPPDAELVVIGMQSDFCIRATCSAALGRGNEVLMIRVEHNALLSRYSHLSDYTGSPCDI